MVTLSEIKVLILNVRSVRKNFGEFVHFLDRKGFRLDVIALTETWITPDAVGRYTIHGYTQYLENRVDKRSGGVMLYIKEGLMCEVDSLPSTLFSDLKLKLGVSGDSPKFLIYVVYRFCRTSKEGFVNELANYTGVDTGPALLVGDFNIDILSPDRCSDYLNFLASAGFQSLVNEPTRVGFNKRGHFVATCLDHIHLRQDRCAHSLVTADCTVLPIDFSDHSAILVGVCGIGGGVHAAVVPTKFKVVDYQSLTQRLRETDWSEIENDGNVDSDFCCITEKVLNAIDESTIYKAVGWKF